MRSTKIIKNCSSSLCTCLHHMVILRTRNNITDFLMILAWAIPFNKQYKSTRLGLHVYNIQTIRPTSNTFYNYIDQNLIGQPFPKCSKISSPTPPGLPEPLATYPTNTMKIVGAVSFSMMGQRRRRWSNIDTALVECLV